MFSVIYIDHNFALRVYVWLCTLPVLTLLITMGWVWVMVAQLITVDQFTPTEKAANPVGKGISGKLLSHGIRSR